MAWATPVQAPGGDRPRRRRARNWLIAASIVAVVIAAVAVPLAFSSHPSATPNDSNAAPVPAYSPTTAPAGTTPIGWSWGLSSPQPQQIAVVTPVPLTSIATANGLFVALDRHGDAWSWGQLTGVAPPFALSPSNSPAQVPMPAGVRFTRIATDDGYVLAIDQDGRLWSWGRNVEGELGNGSTANSSGPVLVDTPAGVRFTAISAGRFFALALDTEGRAWSWGQDADGVLGNGNAAEIGSENFPAVNPVPGLVAMPPGVTLSAVAAGETNAVALDTTGHVWTWGDGKLGELGVNSASPSDAPGSCENLLARGARIVAFVCSDTPLEAIMPANTRFVAVTAGWEFDLALDSRGRAWTWGSNQYGELGVGVASLQSTCSLTGTCSSEPVPVAAPSSVRFTQVAALQNDAMALDRDGHVWGWGDNLDSELGGETAQCTIAAIASDGPCENKPVALPMPPGGTVRQLGLSPSQDFAFSA